MHVVVTVEARKGQEAPVINREDVMVHEGHARDEVVDWVPAQGEHASLNPGWRELSPYPDWNQSQAWAWMESDPLEKSSCDFAVMGTEVNGKYYQG